MIVIIGFLVLIVAAAVAVAGVATNGGDTHSVGDSFGIFGQHMSGLSTGQLFLFGIGVGVVGMLGLSMLLGVFSRRLASRGSRRELTGSRRETTAARAERDRLSLQLEDERADHGRADRPTGQADPSPGRADPITARDRSPTRATRYARPHQSPHGSLTRY